MSDSSAGQDASQPVWTDPVAELRGAVDHGVRRRAGRLQRVPRVEGAQAGTRRKGGVGVRTVSLSVTSMVAEATKTPCPLQQGTPCLPMSGQHSREEGSWGGGIPVFSGGAKLWGGGGGREYRVAIKRRLLLFSLEPQKVSVYEFYFASGRFDWSFALASGCAASLPDP